VISVVIKLVTNLQQ